MKKIAIHQATKISYKESLLKIKWREVFMGKKISLQNLVMSCYTLNNLIKEIYSYKNKEIGIRIHVRLDTHSLRYTLTQTQYRTNSWTHTCVYSHKYICE